VRRLALCQRHALRLLARRRLPLPRRLSVARPATHRTADGRLLLPLPFSDHGESGRPFLQPLRLGVPGVFLPFRRHHPARAGRAAPATRHPPTHANSPSGGPPVGRGSPHRFRHPPRHLHDGTARPAPYSPLRSRALARPAAPPSCLNAPLSE